jgi:hypothetical protein
VVARLDTATGQVLGLYEVDGQPGRDDGIMAMATDI